MSADQVLPSTNPVPESAEATIPRWLRPYARVTSQGRFLPVVDGLRFVAIMAVLGYHLEDYLVAKAGWDRSVYANCWVHRVLHVGNYGVQLFFMLSGFILALPFVEHVRGRGPAVRLSAYYWRRVTRLEPPYIFNLLLIFALQVLVLKLSFADLWPHLLASLGYVHGLIYQQFSLVNVVAWSLELEVQFYLLAPLLAQLFLSPRWIAATWLRQGLLVGLSIGLMAIKSAAWTTQGLVQFTLVSQLEHFLLGMLLADWYCPMSVAERSDSEVSHRGQAIPSAGLWYDGLSVLGWLGLVCLLLSGGWAWASLPALAAYHGTLHSRWVKWVLSWSLLTTIGGMCYTVYLYHFLFISGWGRWSLRLTTGWGYLPTLVVQGAIILPLTLICCAWMFRWTERPFMVWRPRMPWAMPASATLSAEAPSEFSVSRAPRRDSTPPA